MWDEVLDGSAQALLKEAESDVEPSKEQQARNLVAQLLEEKGGKLSAEDLYESSKSADIGRDATRKAIKSLKLVQTRPTGPRGPMVYERPKEHEFKPLASTPAVGTTNVVSYAAAKAARSANNEDLR